MIEWLKEATDLGFALMEFAAVWVLFPCFFWVLYRVVKTHVWSWDDKEEKDEPAERDRSPGD